MVRTRTKESHATYDSSKYIILPQIYPGTSTTMGYFANACITASKQAYQVGNMKDKVDAQETAMSTVIQYSLLVFLELMAQGHIKDLMDNPPESNLETDLGDGLTGNTNVANFEYMEYNALLNQLTGKLIPKVVIDVIKVFNFVIKYTEAYKIGPVEIPAQYVLPFTPSLSYATIQSYITNIGSNQGQMKRHMDKFGFKYVSFTPDMLDMRIINPDHPDALAWFNHAPLSITGSGKSAYWPQTDGVAVGTYYYPGSIYLNAHNTTRYYFRDNPNESMIHVLAPCLEYYESTYAKYGGLFRTGVSSLLCTTADTFGLSASQVESSEFLRISSTNAYFALKKFFALYNSSHTLIYVELGGTNIAEVKITDYDLAHDIDLKYGTLPRQEVMEEALLQYLGDCLVK